MVASITARFGVTHRTLRQIVERAGVPLRWPRLTANLRQDLARRVQGGEQITMLREYGISRSTVYRRHQREESSD